MIFTWKIICMCDLILKDLGRKRNFFFQMRRFFSSAEKKNGLGARKLCPYVINIVLKWCIV